MCAMFNIYYKLIYMARRVYGGEVKHAIVQICKRFKMEKNVSCISVWYDKM